MPHYIGNLHVLHNLSFSHHHHVPERLGMFPVPWSSRWSWSLHLFLGHFMFLRPFGLYCSACFGSLFVSILCTCCSHFYWYCFISFTTFCAPVFCLIHWFFSFLSFSLFYINQLDALNFFNEFISCLYMFRAQVLIVRRSKLYYTVSGIITLKQAIGLKLLK